MKLITILCISLYSLCLAESLNFSKLGLDYSHVERGMAKKIVFSDEWCIIAPSFYEVVNISEDSIHLNDQTVHIWVKKSQIENSSLEAEFTGPILREMFSTFWRRLEVEDINPEDCLVKKDFSIGPHQGILLNYGIRGNDNAFLFQLMLDVGDDRRIMISAMGHDYTNSKRDDAMQAAYLSLETILSLRLRRGNSFSDSDFSIAFKGQREKPEGVP